MGTSLYVRLPDEGVRIYKIDWYNKDPVSHVCLSHDAPLYFYVGGAAQLSKRAKYAQISKRVKCVGGDGVGLIYDGRRVCVSLYDGASVKEDAIGEGLTTGRVKI